MTIQEVCECLKSELLDNGYEYGFFLDGKKYKPNMTKGFDSEYFQLSTTIYRVQNPEVTMREKIGTCVDTVMVMKMLLDQRQIPNTIWLLHHKPTHKVHTIVTFEAESKIVYLELTPQFSKAHYGHEIVCSNMQEFLREYEQNGFEVSDVTDAIIIGQQPIFLLEKGNTKMISVREANYEDMPRVAGIMVTSLRTAFAAFVSPETMDARTNPDNCRAMLEHIYQEGKMHFLMGGDQGFLCWQETEDGAEIVAIHSLPVSWGTGLGHAMLTEALQQIGNRPVFLWVFKENARACRFYEKHGFHRDGIQRISEFDGAPEVRYVKSHMQLLRADESHAERIRDMQKEAFAALLEKYQDHETSPANETLERITWKLQQPDSYFYQIEVDGKVVGGIRVVDAGDGSPKRISPLFILPQHRGKGYAQRAILEAEKRHGAHNWELGTILQEAGNCYLYEKMGYRQTSKRTVIHDTMTIVGYEKNGKYD